MVGRTNPMLKKDMYQSTSSIMLGCIDLMLKKDMYQRTSSIMLGCIDIMLKKDMYQRTSSNQKYTFFQSFCVATRAHQRTAPARDHL